MAAKDEMIQSQAEELAEARKTVEQHDKDKTDILNKYMVLLESKGAMADIQAELLAAQKALLEKEVALVQKEESLQKAERALAEKDKDLRTCQTNLDKAQAELEGYRVQVGYVTYQKPKGELFVKNYKEGWHSD